MAGYIGIRHMAQIWLITDVQFYWWYIHAVSTNQLYTIILYIIIIIIDDTLD